MTKKLLLVLIAIILLATGCSSINDKNKRSKNESASEPDFEKKVYKEENYNEEKKYNEKDEIRNRIDSMSLKEKIGQLLIVGFEGIELNNDIEVLIDDYKVGGVILFSRNITDSNLTFKLINDIKQKNLQGNIPLLISVDEEGGRVSRLTKEFKELPSAKTIGSINNRDISFGYGKIIGQRLNSLGFNLDFAPVLDINSNPKNPVIGDRAFGADKERVTKNSMQVINGLNEEKIIPVVKHFPGHGDTSIDSHEGLPIVDKTKEDLESLELVPFKNAIEKNIDSIMVGHILFNKIDKEYPATMSKQIITKILREELDFNGVVFSDDMTMGAIIQNHTIEQASIKFLESGGDILLICHGRDNPKLVFEAIEKAVDNSIINESEINQKVYRILNLKEKYNINDEKMKEFNIEKVKISTEDFLKKAKEYK